MERIWAFTNENLLIFSKITTFPGKQIFAIGGAGDQAISFLGWGADNLVVCDKNELSCLFIEFKLAALRNLTFSEVLRIFGLKKLSGHQRDGQIYRQKIRNDLSQKAQNFFDNLFFNSQDIYQSLKKSKIFHRESWYFAKKGYISYLENSSLFQKIKNIKKPLLFNTDFINALKLGNLKFDLIYLSNVLDIPGYLKNPSKVWPVLIESLREKGQILIVTQKKLSKITNPCQKFRLRVSRCLKTKTPFYPFLPGYPYHYLLIERD